MKPLRSIGLVALFLILLSCEKGDRMPRAFVGTWISDAELTLQGARESNAISEERLAMFEDDFFGHRVIIFGERESRAYFDNEDSRRTFSPNRIVDSGADFVVILIPETAYSPEYEQSWHAQGDFIYAYDDKWQFKEYFRQVVAK